MTNIEKFINHFESVTTPELGSNTTLELENAINLATGRMTPVFD